MSKQSWWQGVRRDQWLVLFVAWLGWVFDAMDATIYAIVLHPAPGATGAGFCFNAGRGSLPQSPPS